MDRRLKKALLVAILAAAIPPFEACALITGGNDHAPRDQPGWPQGAAVIFNNAGRIAWWEGPPFGGGQWHAECRGDAEALNAVLAHFAALDVKAKRIVVHDGAGRSFWIAPNHEPEKQVAARIDWVFMVWETDRWETLRKLPADLNPTRAEDDSPPSQIDVYTSHLRWSDVTVPKGIEILDQRLEAHGFTAADGIVFEGKVKDLKTQLPLAATIRLERVEPRKTGGYAYPVVAETRTDTLGHWVLRRAPTAWVRVVVEAEGFVPRVAGYARVEEEPRWQSFDCGLSRPAPVSGRVTDDSGNPLPNAEIRLSNVVPSSGGRYESPREATSKTDADGRFRLESVPAGKATIWLHKPGYVRPGLGLAIATPQDGIALTMQKSAGLRVHVDFTGKVRPGAYLVTLEPEGGNTVGSFGGTANLDPGNRVSFDGVPPGRYVLRGQPNPTSGNQVTDPVTVELKGGQTEELTLKAR